MDRNSYYGGYGGGYPGYRSYYGSGYGGGYGHHHHHHFKCEACNKVFDIETCGLPIEKLLPAGFTHQAHDITIFGTCKDCN